MELSNKRILVTGADGFIGSHLTEALLHAAAKVKAFAHYNSFNSWGWLEDIDHLNEIEVISGDIRDSYFLEKVSKGIDIIFHLGALISIPYSYSTPNSYIETNIKGTLNICQAALQNGIDKLIHTSTSEVYGTAMYVPINEKHPLQAQSPYAATKIGADAIAESFYRSFNLPICIARPFNTYGPRQSARAVIAAIITQIALGSKKIKLGNIKPTRDFNYVKDICQGFLKIAESDKATGEILNIGSNYEISISNVFMMIGKIMNANVQIMEDTERIRPERSEVMRLLCDNSKIKQLTGFKPKYDLERGLAETIEWFVKPKNLKRYKGDIYNV